MRKDQELTFEAAQARGFTLNICNAIRKNWRNINSSSIQIANLRFRDCVIEKHDTPGSTDVAFYMLPGVATATVNAARDVSIRLEAGVTLTDEETQKLKENVLSRCACVMLQEDDDEKFYKENAADAIAGMGYHDALQKLSGMGFDKENQKRRKQREQDRYRRDSDDSENSEDY